MGKDNVVELSEREQRLAARAEQANADSWARWTSDIGQRLAQLEARFGHWFGANGDGACAAGLVKMMAEIIDRVATEERAERAAALGELADSWSERLAAE